MSNLEFSLDGVRNKETFITFLGVLIDDHEKNGGRWENKTLKLFLEGMQGWLEDMDLDDFYQRIDRQDVAHRVVNWRVFADVLVAATVYE